MSETASRFPKSLRDELPRSQSYPLRRTDVDAALLSAEVDWITLIYFLCGGQLWTNDRGKVISVRFQAATHLPEQLELRIYSVPSHLKASIATALGETAFASVAQWIAEAGKHGAPWHSMDHLLQLRWNGAGLAWREFDSAAASWWYADRY